MFLAASMMAVGLEPKPPGISVVYSREKPKSEGGDVTAYFKSHTKDGFCPATKLQKAWENAQLGTENPESYQLFNAIIERIDGLDEVPKHVRAKIANSLKEVAPRMVVEGVKLFLAHYKELKLEIKKAKPYVKASTGGKTFEMRPVKTAKDDE